MTSADRWLLPEGIDEILPQEAYVLELQRRQILDLFSSWGYQLVITPLIEYLDSLLVGSSHDLDLHTFKVTDQLSGRMMGIRADITPQVARIDAHCLNRSGPVRLCYADIVLHTKPRALLTSRAPLRIGAELFGHSGVEADIELICLMYRTLELAGIKDIHIVLGHVGVFRTLVSVVNLDAETEASLFKALQRKAYEEIDLILQQSITDKGQRQLLYQLSRLSGDSDTLLHAVDVFKDAPEPVKREIGELEAVARGVSRRIPAAVLCFDLCELRGYEYHTGIVFAAYTPEKGTAIAQGGRYNHIGEVFGRARPASGFDCDLNALVRLTNSTAKRIPGILAPSIEDARLLEMVEALRQQGEIVIMNLSESPFSKAELAELECDREISLRDGSWVVTSIR